MRLKDCDEGGRSAICSFHISMTQFGDDAYLAALLPSTDKLATRARRHGRNCQGKGTRKREEKEKRGESEGRLNRKIWVISSKQGGDDSCF